MKTQRTWGGLGKWAGVSTLVLVANCTAADEPTAVVEADVLTGPMVESRRAHGAALLEDGRVLIVGGRSAVNSPLATAEIYDPATDTFTATSNLVDPRGDHRTTLLTDGRVMATGGYIGGTGGVARTEIWNPATGTWTNGPWLAQGRSQHAAVRLNDGRVLITGGITGTSGSDASAEILDPVTNSRVSTGSMSESKWGMVATLLADGSVIVTGGNGQHSTDWLSTIERWQFGGWTVIGQMNTFRANHSATLLDNGLILLAGGRSQPTSRSAELLNPASGVSTVTGSMVNAHEYHTAFKVPGGVVVVGGYNEKSVERYDIATGTWTVLGTLDEFRQFPTATMLDNGDVLVAGNGTAERLPCTLLGSCVTAAAQEPWHENANGEIYMNLGYNYAMGYHFTPNVDGEVTALGGFFSGTKIVRLFDRTSGTLLGETTVTASNDWQYNVMPAVPVTAGHAYTVAVYLAGSGGSYRVGFGTFPQTYGDITIDASAYAYTGSNPSARPTASTIYYMYGQADVRFVPASGSSPTGAIAIYDATLGAPACDTFASRCDSDTLLVGRGPNLGPELNEPNTIDGCADGGAGTFHSDESLDAMSIYTIDGSDFSGGATVRVEVTAWAWNASDSLDLYYATNLASPTWTFVGTQPSTSSGAMLLSSDFTLPTGVDRVAIRGQWRYYGSATPCSSGGYNERDDLVIRLR